MKTTKYKVAKRSELSHNEMKLVEIGNTKVLLYRIQDAFFATSPICPHYGAPLEEGIISDGRVICPWHHSAFDIESGDLLEPPSCDAIVSYEVQTVGNDVWVYIPKEASDRRLPSMTNRSEDQDGRTFVIVGAGAAGYASAQALREDGFKGRIVMVTAEKRAPYDRPNLSKEYLQGEAPMEWMPLRPDDFFDQYDIEILTDRLVQGVDSRKKTVSFENGDRLSFDKLLLAVGGRPRRLDVPGSDLDNVFTLRSFDDSDRIIDAAKRNKRVVIVGGGFIGMEAGFSLKKRDLDVTMVMNEEVPLQHVFGPDIGKLIQKHHERHGVQFKSGRTVREFTGDGTVSGVVLDNGQTIETDFVVVGVGIDPASDRIQGVKFADDGSVLVDEFLMSEENIYAAGDIATFGDWRTSSNSRIEHWRTAEQQGRIAAHNMMGRSIAYRSIPFFWTNQAELHLRYVGHAPQWDEIITHGKIKEANFISYFVKDDKVLAAVGIGRDKQLIAIEELMRQERMPAPGEIRKEHPDMVALVHQTDAVVQ